MPHFMRRKLEDGQELVLLASVEEDDVIHGILHIGDTSYNVTLQTGEIAAYTEKEAILAPKVVQRFTKEVKICDRANVRWEQENIIPLEYWEDETGKAVCKTAESNLHSFTYRVKEKGVKGVKLFIPAHCKENIEEIYFDKEALHSYQETKVFDESYCCYELTRGSDIGIHTLSMKMKVPMQDYDRVFLQGDFGVNVTSQSPYAQQCGRQYSLHRFIPGKAEIILTERQRTLKITCSWAEQGHPFYSGKATYSIEVSLPDDFGEGILSIPEVHDGCIVYVDGKKVGESAFQPYQFVLGDIGGNHVLDITVYNSMGNAMECYLAPSGITAGILIGGVSC